MRDKQILSNGFDKSIKILILFIPIIGFIIWPIIWFTIFGITFLTVIIAISVFIITALFLSGLHLNWPIFIELSNNGCTFTYRKIIKDKFVSFDQIDEIRILSKYGTKSIIYKKENGKKNSVGNVNYDNMLKIKEAWEKYKVK